MVDFADTRPSGHHHSRLHDGLTDPGLPPWTATIRRLRDVGRRYPWAIGVLAFGLGLALTTGRARISRRPGATPLGSSSF